MDDRKLEELLSARRDMVPPAGAYLGWLADEAAAVRAARPSMWRRLLDVSLSMPGVSVISCLTVASWSFWHRDAIVSFFSSFGDASGAVAMGRSIGLAISTMTGGDTMVIGTVYGVLTLAILAALGSVTLRFVRE